MGRIDRVAGTVSLALALMCGLLLAAPPARADVAPTRAAAVAVAWAYRELGKPYVWAADGPDRFDCSGLAMYVWSKAGVQLPHYTGDQWNAGRHVSRDALAPGDLVFFYSDLH